MILYVSLSRLTLLTVCVSLERLTYVEGYFLLVEFSRSVTVKTCLAVMGLS